MTTVDILMELHYGQPNYLSYKFCRNTKDIPFTLRAQVINKYRKQLRRWEKLANV